MAHSFRRNQQKPLDYRLLHSEHDGRTSGRWSRMVHVTVFKGVLFGLVLITMLIASFLGGRYTSQSGVKDSIRCMLSCYPKYRHWKPVDPRPVHSAPRVLEYDERFAARPNITTDKAWLDLFPTLGGFFTHPKIAPKRSTFAVFHQLHCLDGIRHGYWYLYDMVLKGEKVDEDHLPHHLSASHFMHCVDLLRNILMCQPDLTIEVQDSDAGGVEGFGTEHICVDWKQLVEWTSAREMAGQDKVVEEFEDEREKEEPHIHGNTGA